MGRVLPAPMRNTFDEFWSFFERNFLCAIETETNWNPAVAVEQTFMETHTYTQHENSIATWMHFFIPIKMHASVVTRTIKK
jgi:hypothetical protein